MLPVVLGGIALAAVGYGVKEFCESEGCPWDEDTVSLRSSSSETTKLEERIITGKLASLKDILRDMNAHDDMGFVFVEEYVLVEANQVKDEEATLYLRRYRELLLRIEETLRIYHALLSLDQRHPAEDAYEFVRSVERLFVSLWQDESGSVSVDWILCLRRCESLCLDLDAGSIQQGENHADI